MILMEDSKGFQDLLTGMGSHISARLINPLMHHFAFKSVMRKLYNSPLTAAWKNINTKRNLTVYSGSAHHYCSS